MHSNFGEWYRNVSLTADHETLKKRWAGVTAATVAREDVLQLIRLSFSEDGTPAFVEKFRGFFRTADEKFPAQDNDAELQLLASAVLIDLLGSNRDDVAKAEMLAAIGSVAADLGGLRRRQSINPELIKQAYGYLKSASVSRADWKTLEQPGEPTNDELKAALAVTSEETNILWWLFGETSRDSDKLFSSQSVDELAFVAGKELSDLTRVAPGPISVPTILARVLGKGKGKDVQTELVERAKIAPADWDAVPAALPDNWLTTSPVRSMVRAARSGVDADKRRIQLGLKKGVKLSSSAFAEQLYWEFQWERAWNHG